MVYRSNLPALRPPPPNQLFVLDRQRMGRKGCGRGKRCVAGRLVGYHHALLRREDKIVLDSLRSPCRLRAIRNLCGFPERIDTARDRCRILGAYRGVYAPQVGGALLTDRPQMLAPRLNASDAQLASAATRAILPDRPSPLLRGARRPRDYLHRLGGPAANRAGDERPQATETLPDRPASPIGSRWHRTQ